MFNALEHAFGNRPFARPFFPVIDRDGSVIFRSFAKNGSTVSVVFTGSQIPIGVLRTDGRENLITAIEIAGAKRDGKPIVPEVSLLFHSRLCRGNRTHKSSAEELDAFRSANYPPLAEVGVKIAYNTAAIRQVEPKAQPLRIATMLSEGVAIIKLFPGIGEYTLRAILSVEGLRGVVLETYGAGNAPTDAFKYISQRGCA